MKKRICTLALLGFVYLGRAAVVQPVPDVVKPAVPDVASPLEPSAVRIDGWLGQRIDQNERNRLLVVDTVPLLAGYKQKPGTHPWIGEHVGKWLHAATLAWAYSGDAALRKKLDGVAAELIATQEPDGYLGTYVKGQRFGLNENADWDVWSHKYNLIGLLTYYRYTGNEPALVASRKIGDLLIATFPGQKSILAAGTHMGMAATSILGPVVDLYRLTGDVRYLDFARYIVKSYEEPGGPDIVRSLTKGTKRVSLTANGKAYEMLSNLVGIGELYRATGEARLFEALQNAWSDIVANRLYLTGTTSVYELFGADHELPNGEGMRLGETCVTVTWIQLNRLMLELTGEAKFADEIERSLYNHLTAAQNPRGDDWCYYTALDGAKHYDKDITCCHSSGPRGLALAPTVAYLQSGDTLFVSTLETSRADFNVNGQSVQLIQQSAFPIAGRTMLTIKTTGSARFALKIRVPAWAAPLRAGSATGAGGWLVMPAKDWHDGEQLALEFSLQARMIKGEYTNYGRVAYGWGPFILAADEEHNPGWIKPTSFRSYDATLPVLSPKASNLVFMAKVRGGWDREAQSVQLVPFADAGADGGQLAVWLRAPQ